MIENLLKIVERKVKFDEDNPWFKNSEQYLDCLVDEVSEVREELKENNKIYLEDELWDIIYCYLNLLLGLQKEGKIESIETVLKAADRKYSERISAIEKWKEEWKIEWKWSEVKAFQKERMKKEHEDLYGKD